MSGFTALHVAAILFYLLRGENLLPSMLRGRGRSADSPADSNVPSETAASAWRIGPGIGLAGLIVWLVVRG